MLLQKIKSPFERTETMKEVFWDWTDGCLAHESYWCVHGANNNIAYSEDSLNGEIIPMLGLFDSRAINATVIERNGGWDVVKKDSPTYRLAIACTDRETANRICLALIEKAEKDEWKQHLHHPF